MSTDLNTCQLCTKEKAKYSCPRCNRLYCSVQCYKSPAHLQCSENFYRKCIEEEMAGGGSSGSSTREATMKMHEILKRMSNNHHEPDIEEIFIPPLNGSSGEESDLDSDDDTPSADLAARLEGVDLNDPDAVWCKLTAEEQHEFEGIVNAGDISSFVPLHTPWWIKMQERKLVQEASSAETTELNHPEILSNIKNFKDISPNKSPSPCVRHNLTNILSAYMFSVRHFNGDFLNLPREFSGLFANICGNIKNNTNYTSDPMAIESVAHEARNVGISVDRDNSHTMREDIEMIFKKQDGQRRNTAVLAALSDIHRILSFAKMPKESNKSSSGVFSRKFVDTNERGFREVEQSRVRVYVKKIEFFLSFAKDIL